MKAKSKVWDYVLDYALVIVGTFLMGVSFNSIFAPNNITPSGFSGLSAIVSYFIGLWTGLNVPASIIYLLINVVLYIFAFKKLGKRFAISALVGILSYSLFMEICHFNFMNIFTDDNLLCAIYGGLVTGIGLGLVFRGHGSTGGSDMLACILNKKYPNIKIGSLVLIIDALVIAISAFAHGINLSLYSLIGIYIMTKVTDVIVDGVKSVTAYHIITKKPKEISDKIMHEIARGVTAIQTRGMYTQNNQEMLVVIVTRSQVARLKSIVAEIDDTAFMYATSVSEAMGEGFNKIKKIKKVDVAKLSEESQNQINSLSLKKEEQITEEQSKQVENSEV